MDTITIPVRNNKTRTVKSSAKVQSSTPKATKAVLLQFAKVEIERRALPKTDKRRSTLRRKTQRLGLLAYTTSDLVAFVNGQGHLAQPVSTLSSTDRKRKQAQRAFKEAIASQGYKAAMRAYKAAITA